MLSPTHLATLQTVIEQGSFVAAAKELGYTASAVSQQMRMLERATGLELFERFAKGIRPTSAAYYLAETGREMVLGLRALEQDARALAAAERGHIAIGSFRSACAHLVPTAFAAFGERRPGVTLQLTEGEPHILVPRLLSGSLDLGVVYENELDLRDWPGTLVRIPLLTEERKLLMPPAARPDASVVDIASLRDWTWIASDPAPSLVRYCVAAGFEPNIALQTNDYYSVCAMVRAGLGVALVPAISRYLTSELVPIEPRPRAPRRHVFILHRVSNRNPALPELIGELRRAAEHLAATHPQEITAR